MRAVRRRRILSVARAASMCVYAVCCLLCVPQGRASGRAAPKGRLEVCAGRRRARPGAPHVACWELGRSRRRRMAERGGRAWRPSDGGRVRSAPAPCTVLCKICTICEVKKRRISGYDPVDIHRYISYIGLIIYKLFNRTIHISSYRSAVHRFRNYTYRKSGYRSSTSAPSLT